MDLYLYSKRIDLVATTLADLQALIVCLSFRRSAENSGQTPGRQQPATVS